MRGSKSIPSGRQDRKGFIEEMEFEPGTEVRGRKVVGREHSIWVRETTLAIITRHKNNSIFRKLQVARYGWYV